MSENFILEDLLVMLRKVDNPTVCNAIEVVEGDRGFTRITHRTSLSGAVTSGVIRARDALKDGFSFLAGSIGVSRGFVHMIEIGAPVDVIGVRVGQGDLIHAYRHGVLIVPTRVISNLKNAIATVIF